VILGNNTEPKFIALEDEVRTEIGDTVTYTSKEVDFKQLLKMKLMQKLL
jgi:hypothetical protein